MHYDALGMILPCKNDQVKLNNQMWTLVSQIKF